MTQWEFVTESLAARPKRPDDAPQLHAVFGDPEVMRHLGGPLPSLAATSDLVAQHIAHHETHGFGMWTLVERASDEVVGDAGFLVYEQGVEIGWHLRRASWGQGLATEAARACLAHGSRNLGLTRISAFVESANTASIRVIEKLGMTLVRSAREDGVPPWCEYTIPSDPR